MATVPRLSPLPHDRTFFDLFIEAGSNGVHAAKLLDKMMAEWPDTGTLGEQIVESEHRGDKITHSIVKRLNTTEVSPIDREDVYGLATAIDDVVDYTEQAAAQLDLYGVEAPMEQAVEFADVLVACGGEILGALRCLHGGGDLSAHLVEIHRLENEGDRLQRDTVTSLFAGGIDPMVVIRWKDIYERLEQAIDACEHVANVLEGIVIKNS